jgi:hypothetical protein
VLACVYRAPTYTATRIDLTFFLLGRTGAFKSELAAAMQAHFGDFSGRDFCSSWEDTVTDIEMKASHAKDAVFVIDDFKPVGGKSGVDKLHAKADRIIRGAGNQWGRGRRNSNLEARPTYHPRCLLVAKLRQHVVHAAQGPSSCGLLHAVQAPKEATRPVIRPPSGRPVVGLIYMIPPPRSFTAGSSLRKPARAFRIPVRYMSIDRPLSALTMVRAGGPRYALDGTPAGEVSEPHRAAAGLVLERRSEKHVESDPLRATGNEKFLSYSARPRRRGWRQSPKLHHARLRAWPSYGGRA